MVCAVGEQQVNAVTAPWCQMRVAHQPRPVQDPFVSATQHVRVTVSEVRLRGPHYADSVAADRLWDALSRARVAERHPLVAELEDAVFQSYLPMARSLADRVRCDTGAERRAADQAAELGLAHAVLRWQQPTSGGFRRFARATILRQLLNR